MFWIISAVLILIALAFILPPLRNCDVAQDATREQNIAIAQEQFVDLEARFEQGEIDQEGYQSIRNELEQSLFDDLSSSENHLDQSSTQKNRSKYSLLSSALILLLIPVITIPLYLKMGNLDFTKLFDSRQAAEQARKSAASPDIEKMVVGLQKKMNQNPDDAKGWYMLGRSYMVLKRYPEAVESFDRVHKLIPQSVDTMLSLADALSMSNQGQLIGRPAELVSKALKIEPNNTTALWLSGMVARQTGKYLEAVTQWNKILPLIKDKPQEMVAVNDLISEATSNLSSEQKSRLSTTVSVSTPSAVIRENTVNQSAVGIKVTVSLADKLKTQTNPNDLVFIYAKAMNGPPMPLAALRKQVKDLPIEVLLNDELAMIPSLKLSSFTDVIVGARVSKSGRPIAQNGDLYTEQSAIKVGTSMTLEINAVISK